MWNQVNVASELIVGMISGILTVPLLSFLVWLYRRFKSRRARRFWEPFVGQKIAIIMTEYPAIGDDLSAKTARQAGGGFLLSRGNAMALSNLLDFLPDNVSKRANLTVGGDKSGVQSYEHLVIIGSPANNLFSQNVFSALQERFVIPYDVLYDEHTGTIGFRSKDGSREYLPRIEDGNGVDYAIIVRAKYRSYPSRYAIVLAGAYMFGAQAASSAVTNREILNQVTKISQDAENLVFLVKTDVINSYPGDPELEFGKDVFVHVLQEN